MAQLDWRDFGAQPGGVVDCTAAINRCFEVAIETGLEAHGPAGIYKTTGPLLWNDPYPRISGEGAVTVIRPDDRDYDWLTVGTQVMGEDPIGPPIGWVRDLHLHGLNETASPPGTKVGLKLDGARGIDVRNVRVRFAPIGFDLVNNCYGSSFTNCRTIFDECRVGMVLRGQNVSGSDIPLYNCWLHGRECGAWIEGLAGGYHFHGGQIHAGINGSSNDNLGAVVIGAALDTATGQGGVDATFLGTSFEFVRNYWNVRAFGRQAYPNGIKLRFVGCSFWGAYSGDPLNAKGVLKLTNGYDDVLVFQNVGVHGTYATTTPVSINLAAPALNARPCFEEVGTWGVPVFNGVTLRLLDVSMLMHAQVGRGHARTGLTWLDSGMMFRINGVVFEKSTDWGSTWAAV